MNLTGISTWKGSWKKGNGTLSTQTRILEAVPVSYSSRFEHAPGAIPEELLAAAHAACYNQALANIAGQNQLETTSINTTVNLDLGFDDAGRPEIKSIHFNVEAAIPGASEQQFQTFAEGARVGCAISKIIKLPTTINARLLPG
ncbi:osmotically inducible protein OsmC [Filimonas lacunae]|uniref:Osmotically inducible protein OsmC n=1 Tax=Filimonas lacunae TaxID=477680 RepID=A0A173MBH7_9BACT|nr:OsmC family peroxiredoxin [Filimonas lacunae]BAV04914.1 osmotically inducible protein C [Filimonas lacunae]SIT33809.1 osmotically inducible protein OsmC [Filimonas lacunae]